MWCAACQQDVPALQMTGRSEVRCCVRCRRPFQRTNQFERADDDVLGSSTSPFKASAQPDRALADRALADRSRADAPWDWQAERQLESDLRIAATLVRSLGVSRVPQIGGDLDPFAPWTRIRRRIEATANGRADHTATGTDPLQCDDSERHDRRTPECPQATATPAAISLPARVLLAIGIMIFVCGASLMIGSLVSGRQDLRSVGLPLVVAGQGVLLLALRLQFNGLWRSQRAAAGELTRLSRLTDPIDLRDESASQAESVHASARTASAYLGSARVGSAREGAGRPEAARRASPSRKFAFHAAGEPSPHRVIADLKSQLDDLAAKIDRFEP